VRALGAKRHRGAIDAIAEVVAGRKLRDADLTEKTAFFEAYALLSGAEGMKRLKALLEPKGILRRKEDPQIRACAAMALGQIDTPDARETLQRAANDKDPLVRNAAQRALEGTPRT
jgi:HEAT repeat protein